MIDWTSVVKAFPKSAQKHMRRPDKWKDIPSLNDGYLMWAPPNVNRAYLLEDVTGNLNGWELSFDPKVRTKRRAEMCDLCKFVHGGRSCGVAFFSIPLS